MPVKNLFMDLIMISSHDLISSENVSVYDKYYLLSASGRSMYRLTTSLHLKSIKHPKLEVPNTYKNDRKQHLMCKQVRNKRLNMKSLLWLQEIQLKCILKYFFYYL